MDLNKRREPTEGQELIENTSNPVIGRFLFLFFLL
jgi:hypothetical protein